MEEEKVFIVGCPRSGTKLIVSILNRYRRICILPETHFFLTELNMILGRKNQTPDRVLSKDDVERLIDRVYRSPKISSYWQWLIANVEVRNFKSRLLNSDLSERTIFLELLKIYAEHTRSMPLDNLILGEKTPAHIDHVPTLLEWFPQAKIIHTFRDPRAITMSEIKKVKKKGLGLRRKFPFLPTWLTNAMDTPFEVMHISRLWLNAVRLHTKYSELYPNNYYMIRFEDLVSHPETHIKAVCNFLEIPFERQMLEIVVVGSSYRKEQRGPTGFDTEALERWKMHLDPLARIWFSIAVRKQLKQLGYVP